MEHIRIKSANHRFLTELAKVRGQSVEDVLDRIVVEWAATVARRRMQPDAIPAPVGANGLNASERNGASGKVIEIPRKTLAAQPPASANAARGPAAVLHF